MWYNDNMLLCEEQICLKMYVTYVYQFRRALQNLHIVQLMNFRYHINCKDRIIAQCSKEDCPFYGGKQDSRLKKRFCIRNMHFEHSCGPFGESCRVNYKWVVKAYE